MDSDEDPSKEGEESTDEDLPESMMDSNVRDKFVALRNHQIRFEDAIDPNAERVFELQPSDVVFGRGRGYQNHAGNQRLRNMIEKYKTRYHSLKRDGKRKLVASVYQEILDGGARFLKKLDTDDGKDIWVVVDRPIALQKVSHTMRCRKSIIRQLDEDGNVPEAVGGPPRLASTGSSIGPANHNFRPGVLNDNLASVHIAKLANPVNILAPIYGQLSLAELEAQRFSALERYRALSRMACMVPVGTGYQEMLRRQQLERETLMLQQMGDSLALNSASIPASLLPNQGRLLGRAFRSGPAQGTNANASIANPTDGADR